MKEKLEYLLRTGGYTATSLARLLEIQPSGLSHILSGRNKPSFDLVVKILRAFPDVNPDWLLLDSEEVYRTTAAPSFAQKKNGEDDEKLSSLPFALPSNIATSESLSEQKNGEATIFSHVEVSGKRVEKVIVLYSDKTFDSYSAK